MLLLCHSHSVIYVRLGYGLPPFVFGDDLVVYGPLCVRGVVYLQHYLDMIHERDILVTEQ